MPNQLKEAVFSACLIAALSIGAVAAQTPGAATPPSGEHQFGQPETIELLLAMAKKWNETGAPQLGIGDISMRDLADFRGHLKTGDHKTGLGIDIRPMRKDGRGEGVRWDDPAYDRETTQRLVDMLNETGQVERIVFGDPQLKGTIVYRGLDDHLHITVKPREK